jgi:nucleoside-triphosphatase THEP1
VTLLDQDTSVVDGLGKTELVDTGLQTTLKEVLDTEGQDVIELHAGLIEHTNADQTTNQSVTFEKTLGVLLVEGEKLTRPEYVSYCSQLSQG